MNGMLRRFLVLGLTVALTACGGGGGGSPAPVAPPVAPPPTPTPTIQTLAASFDGGDLRATTPLVAPTAVRDLHADAMVYDRQRDHLLVASSPAGNSTLQGLSPLTLQTVWSVVLPAAATAMALSDDGSALYVGLSDGTVQQYELPTHRLVRTIELTEGRGTVYFPTSLAVRPGRAGTVAIASGTTNPQTETVFHRLAVWQDGIKWPQTLEVGSVLNNEAEQLMFTNADTLVSLGTGGGSAIILRIPVQGQMLAPQFPGIGTTRGKTLQMYNGSVLVDNGSVIEPATLRFTFQLYGNGGTFTALADTGTLSEVSLDRVDSAPYQTRILLSEYFSDRFNLKRQAVFDVAPIVPGGNYTPLLTRAIDAGKGRVALQIDAFHKKEAKLVVLDSNAVAPVPTPPVVTLSTRVQDVNVLSVTLPLSGMAYDRQRDRLVGIIGPGGGPIGNSLVVLNPADGSIEARYLLSSRPGSVRVSDSGSVAYVTLPEENGFQRVDIGAGGALRWRVTGLRVPITGLAIMPGDDDTVATVWAYNTGFSVYRGGALVSETLDVAPFVYMSDITFNGAHEIVVLDQHTTGNMLTRYSFAGPTPVLTDSQPKPLWQSFGTAEFRGDTMQDRFSYASVASGKRIGWIMKPEGRVMESLNLPSSFHTYGQVSLWDSTQGFGTQGREWENNPLEIDYLSAQAGAQGGTTDLIGSRRLKITDARWPQSAVLTVDYRAVVATGPHTAVLSRSVGAAANTTLYFIKGL
jgi:hypothetical protein